MNAYIKAISYYLPKYKLTNEMISSDFPEWNVEKIGSKTGINVRHISGKEEYASDMAIKVAEKLFDEHKIDKTKIDFLLYCTQSPDYFLPTTACTIQEKLGLSTSVGALDFNLGCSGYVYGLSLAKGLIFGRMANNILLITSETYSKFIHPKDKSNKTIFSDGAAASLISNEGGVCAIGDFVFGTDGKGANNLIVKNKGIRNQAKRGTDSIDEFGNITNDDNLYMNGSEIFNFTIESIPRLTQAILDKTKMTLDDIDLFIFHQANKYILNHLRKKIGIREERFFISMENTGNTVSSTIPIAIYEAIKQDKFKSINNCIIEGFGVGYSWAACNLIIRK